MAACALKSAWVAYRRCGSARLTRVTPATLEGWVTTAAHLGPADDIKRIVKARYDEATWPVIARPLNDVLRDRQRTALVAYLVARLGLENSNQLYELLLIDVDMGTCMSTSRIVQAIAAVQLFVQRCLLGVEDGVRWARSIPGVGTDELIPVWEANRQVYLFPENWLERRCGTTRARFSRSSSPICCRRISPPHRPRTRSSTTCTSSTKSGGSIWSAVPAGQIDGNLVTMWSICSGEPCTIRTTITIAAASTTPRGRRGNGSGGHRRRRERRRQRCALNPVIWNHRLYLFWPQFMERTDEGRLHADRVGCTQRVARRHAEWERDLPVWQQEKATYDAL